SSSRYFWIARGRPDYRPTCACTRGFPPRSSRRSASITSEPHRELLCMLGRTRLHLEGGLDVKSHRVAALVGTAAVLFLFLPLLTPTAEAQVNPAPKLPAKPYPSTPRLADGTPNLGPIETNKGYWALAQFQDYAKVLQHLREIPYHPWAKSLAIQRRKDQSYWDPQGYCMPPSGPRLMNRTFPMEI